MLAKLEKNLNGILEKKLSSALKLLNLPFELDPKILIQFNGPESSAEQLSTTYDKTVSYRIAIHLKAGPTTLSSIAAQISHQLEEQLIHQTWWFMRDISLDNAPRNSTEERPHSSFVDHICWLARVPDSINDMQLQVDLYTKEQLAQMARFESPADVKLLLPKNCVVNLNFDVVL